MKDEMLTIQDIADLLNQTQQAVYMHARRGDLEILKIGTQYRIPKSKLFSQLGLAGNFDKHVEDKMLSVDDFAKLSKLSTATVHRYINANKLPDFYKLGGSWFVSFSNASKFLGLNYIFDGERSEEDSQLDRVLEQAREILKGELKCKN